MPEGHGAFAVDAVVEVGSARLPLRRAPAPRERAGGGAATPRPAQHFAERPHSRDRRARRIARRRCGRGRSRLHAAHPLQRRFHRDRSPPVGSPLRSVLPSAAPAAASSASSTVLSPSDALPRVIIASSAARSSAAVSDHGTSVRPARRLRRGQQSGRQQRAVAGSRHLGDRLRAGHQRHADIRWQRRQDVLQRAPAARHGDAEIAVAKLAVERVQFVGHGLHVSGDAPQPVRQNRCGERHVTPARTRSQPARAAAVPVRRPACTA